MCCPVSELSVIDQMAYSALSIVSLGVLAPVFFWLLPKFIIFVFREIRLHRAIDKALDGAGDDCLFELLEIISALGNKEPLGCMLHEVSRDTEAGSYTIKLPDGLPDFPWSGQIVRAEFRKLDTENPVAFCFVEDGNIDGVLAPRVYWPPRIGTTGSKARHVQSPAHILKLSSEVSDFAKSAFPSDPKQFLEGVFRRFGLLEYGVRIGLPPVWVQNFRPQRCPDCSRPMRLIIQMPGYEIHKSAGDFVFYLFGCSRHPEKTRSDWDIF
jgi:hypothetical protein